MKLSLSQRLGLVFGGLLLACSGLTAWLQIRAAVDHEQEVIQQLSFGLAAHIAGNANLIDDRSTQAGIDHTAAPALFEMLMKVNPAVEVYLLDDEGRIRDHAAPPGHVKRMQVDLAPLRRFADGVRLPILGDDPRQQSGRKVFSAAPLKVAGEPSGWVYVVLNGEAHDKQSAALGSDPALRTLLGSIALITALGLLAAFVAFRLITRPLRSLTEAVRRAETGGFEGLAYLAREDSTEQGERERTGQPGQIVETGEPGGRLERDEITLLEHAFGRMAQRIAEQWRELIRQDQQRRELVANFSHDLRTPLTSLHGYLETLLLKSGSLDENDRRRYLQTAIAQSAQVGRLAQSLFELARLEYGAVKPERERFLMTELVQDIFQKFELAAQTRHLRLVPDFPPGLPAIDADLGLIERVLTNLLDNAVRHTPEGGEIRVTLAHLDGRLAVEVADTGPGVPAAMRSMLFERPSAFVPVGPRGRGGLGLIIVHRILRLHDSEIRLVDVPGLGAVFRFGLPLTA